MDFYKSLNGLRGWAFLQVLIEHYLLPIFLFPVGIFGVNLFFVLSSYLLTMNLYRLYKKHKKLNLANYFIKRIFRIYPLLTIALICEVLVNRLSRQEAVEVFFLQSCKTLYWTIYVEMRSYLFIPIFVYFFIKIQSLKMRIMIISIITIFSYCWHIYVTFFDQLKMNLRNVPYPHNSFEANILFVNFFSIFFFGSCTAVFYEDYLRKNEKFFNYFENKNKKLGLYSFLILFAHIILLIFVGISLIAFNIQLDRYISTENLSIYFSSIYIILIVLLVAFKDNPLRKLLESRIFDFFGDISFPGYLFNLNVSKSLHVLFSLENNKFKNIILFVITLIILSYFLHVTVEKYFIKISKNIFIDSEIFDGNTTGFKNLHEENIDNEKDFVKGDFYMTISENTDEKRLNSIDFNSINGKSIKLQAINGVI